MILSFAMALMRLAAALLASLSLLALAPALAQTSPCQGIEKAADRLACYDRGSAPPTAQKSTAAAKPQAANRKSASPKEQADQAQIVDMLAAENAKLDAKLKTICRGC
jgi:hypothetical protein